MDLKHPAGLAAFLRLVSTADALLEGFRPGTAQRLGVGYDALRELQPRLVYCSLSGYGQNGPYRDRAGHDINYIARSGVMSYTGKKESGPGLLGIQIADVASGSNNAVIGILAAVVNRHGAGRGQHIDISMTDGMIAFNAMFGAAFLVDGREPVRDEDFLNGGSLYDFYETKDDKYISFGGLEPQFFINFCKTVNRPDLIDGGVFPKGIEKIKKEIRAIFLTKTRDEWVALFNRTDACFEPVLSLAEVFSDALTLEREMVVEVALPGGGSVRQIGSPIKFSESPPEYRHAGVSGAVHTREVLIGLGYTDHEIAEFEKTGLFK